MLWGNIKKKTFVFLNQMQMQDSHSELIKLLLPEIIVEYFELTSYKKKEKKYSIFT
jgi:hypothetical protein